MTVAEAAEVGRRATERARGMRNDPVLSGAVAQAVAAKGIAGADTEDWMKQLKVASLVNYATAPVGAKKYDATTLSR